MTSPNGEESWRETSWRVLGEALDRLSARLAGNETSPQEPREETSSALGLLERKFGLSPFERDVLLLAVGREIDPGIAAELARRQGGEPGPLTFGQALAVLGDPHWSALAPEGVLRRGRLLALGEGPGPASRPVVVEEAVLHYLTGLPQLDVRTAPFVEPVTAPPPLAASQERTVERLAAAWGTDTADGRRIVLLAGDPASARGVAAAACRAIGFGLFAFDPRRLPEDPAAREEVTSLWERDAVLGDLALLVETGEDPDPAVRERTRWLLGRLRGFVAVVGTLDVSLPRPLPRIEVERPNAEEQRELWTSALGPLAARLDGHLDRVTQQFRLPAPLLFAAAAELGAAPGEDPGTELWRICRRRARGGLDALAQRLEAVATWDDLVLPPAQLKILRSLAMHVRRRSRVYEDWGFAARSPRGLGIGALFAGPSGTGKTMAAEVLARDLDLDLYRIDLASVISKYIGETEKNLSRIFDAAEASGALLLFDEADALFGKRSEVKDSHDRYANLEISYLLQRLETYRGLAILTTNLKKSLDTAFLRRLRFIVDFPFPAAADRAEIWRRIFPRATPLDSLAVDRLAQLAIAGGNIRNIALGAAFLAADAERPVSMADLREAARAEYAKLGKTLADAEIRGWE